MIPIPAIDLKGGKVVRLLQGKFKEEKVYFDGPEKIAKRFEEEGASRIHVVDLDGALEGTPKNLSSVEKILKIVRTPLEVGGGIRSIEIANSFLEMGAAWVILGTKACLDRGFLEEAPAELGEKVIVGIDALDGLIATDGWTKVTRTKATDLAKTVQDLGGKTVIYTDISKDGALKGPNLKEIRDFSRAFSNDVIASGGISSLEDLSKIMALKRENIKGVVIGRALYENKFTLKDAVKACSQKE